MGYKTPYKNIACKVSDFFAMIRSIDGKNSKAGFGYCLHEDLAIFRIHLNRLVGYPSVYLKNTARRYSVRRADRYVCGVGRYAYSTLHARRKPIYGSQLSGSPQPLYVILV